MDKLQIEMKNQEQQLEDVDAAKRKITVRAKTNVVWVKGHQNKILTFKCTVLFDSQELKQQNSLLSEARLLLQEEVTGLQAKLDKYSTSQGENMALKVRVEAMETELQEESLRMQELLQQNVQLELDRDKK